MEMLDLIKNPNYEDWGIIETSSEKKIAWRNNSEVYKVYKIPVDILKYNSSNGRIYIETRRFKTEQGVDINVLKEDDPEAYNDEIEKLIWSTAEERNKATKIDIEKYGQMEPGVVLGDGTIIDGNRRFTCIRRLHREHPSDNQFNYFLAAIIQADGKNVTNKMLKEYELRVQFGADEKVSYNVINMNMSIYDLINNNKDDFDYATVSELINRSASDIIKICRTCKLVDEFCDYIGKSGQYQIAEEMKIYWPLEALANHISSECKDMSELEKNKRKHIYFDYLLTLDVELITQNLRDNLIKKVFKNNEDTNELIKIHNEIIGNDIQRVIEQAEDVEEFCTLINELRNSDKAVADKEEYEEIVNKHTNVIQLDLQNKLCKSAYKSLCDINLEPLINANTEIANNKLNEIKEKLESISKVTEGLIKKIEEK